MVIGAEACVLCPSRRIHNLYRLTEIHQTTRIHANIEYSNHLQNFFERPTLLPGVGRGTLRDTARLPALHLSTTAVLYLLAENFPILFLLLGYWLCCALQALLLGGVRRDGFSSSRSAGGDMLRDSEKMHKPHRLCISSCESPCLQCLTDVQSCVSKPWQRRRSSEVRGAIN